MSRTIDCVRVVGRDDEVCPYSDIASDLRPGDEWWCIMGAGSTIVMSRATGTMPAAYEHSLRGAICAGGQAEFGDWDGEWPTMRLTTDEGDVYDIYGNRLVVGDPE